MYEPDAVAGRFRLGLREATLLERQARRIAEHAGLQVGGCGCDAHCNRGVGRGEPFRSLLAPDLFGELELATHRVDDRPETVDSPKVLADVG